MKEKHDGKLIFDGKYKAIYNSSDNCCVCDLHNLHYSEKCPFKPIIEILYNIDCCRDFYIFKKIKTKKWCLVEDIKVGKQLFAFFEGEEPNDDNEIEFVITYVYKDKSHFVCKNKKTHKEIVLNHKEILSFYKYE